jgi:hypothetical protein
MASTAYLPRLRGCKRLLRLELLQTTGRGLVDRRFSWIFWFLSGAVSAARLGLSGIYDQAYKQMGIDPQQMAIHIFGPDSIKILWGIGLLISCAFFALILYTRRYFRPPQQTAE